MNIFNLTESLTTQGAMPEEQVAGVSRRDVFQKLGVFGKKLATGAVPLGATTLLTGQKAMAANETVIDILNFALLLEYLDSTFYTLGLESGVIPAGFQRDVFGQISRNELSQVRFLQNTIRSLGGEPIEKPNFDYTAKGRFMPFRHYDQFLAISQAFEDTGVRAYKGQAPNLMGYDAILRAALQIHSVEARHAARIRRLRALQSWILLDERGKGMPAETQPVYQGEAQVIQGGVNLTTVTTYDQYDVSEAFDEPLTREEVTAIASLFLA
jgi:hypothetical protein